MGKPVIMTNPQNSSEVFNMKYILKNHFGLKARTPISLRRKVKLLNTYSFILNSVKNKNIIVIMIKLRNKFLVMREG